VNRIEPALLDAGVWAAVVDPADAFHEAARSMMGADRSLAALDLTLYEIANVVGAKMGFPEKARSMVRLVLERCRDNVVRVDVALLDSTVGLAAEHGLTAYDAAYVATARRNGWTLVSADVRDLVSKGLAVTPDAALYP
jgi:predicted nucleic acid-binding protein